MEVLRKINKIALIITLLLYLTFYFGLIAQIILGLIQLVIAIIVTIKFSADSRYARIRLGLYWSFVALEILLLYLHTNCWKTSNDFYQILVFIILPISIAIYFTSILNKLAENHEDA